MKAVTVLLLAFLGIGLVARTYDGRIRMLLIAIIGCIVMYITFL